MQQFLLTEVLSKVMKDIWIFTDKNEKIFLFVNVDWFLLSQITYYFHALNHDIDMTVYTDITDKRNANLVN